MGLLSMRFPKDGNTLIIDGGDTIQGSPLTYYCYGHHLPLPVADALNDRQYDFVTLGNHDFDDGYGALESYLTRLNAQCLCANVTDRTGGLPLLPYAVRTMENGLRVGVIGLVTHWVTLWEKPENLTPLHPDRPGRGGPAAGRKAARSGRRAYRPVPRRAGKGSAHRRTPQLHG